MIEPGVPLNESERLREVRSLGLLDTKRERRFDRLTRMAKRYFKVKIALVSLVDEDRQWFKSSQGLDVDETPRNVSFCGHAILGDGLFLIPDALKDARFYDNPFVLKDPKIRFYAGFPLRGVNGHKIGTLCIIDDKPRDFCPDERDMLEDMAAVTEDAISASQMAFADDLTGLFNRRGFGSSARQALSVCERLGQPSVLINFDLDGFKSINDSYGHDQGDKVLVDFARLLNNQFRESDIIGRVGGDEFVVMASGIGKEEVSSMLGRFEKAVDEYNEKSDSEYDIRYSAGFVEKPNGMSTGFEELMREADAQMYQRKKAHKKKALN